MSKTEWKVGGTCPRGHRLTAETLYRLPSSGRFQCRTCKAAIRQTYAAKTKQAAAPAAPAEPKKAPRKATKAATKSPTAAVPAEGPKRGSKSKKATEAVQA